MPLARGVGVEVMETVFRTMEELAATDSEAVEAVVLETPVLAGAVGAAARLL